MGRETPAACGLGTEWTEDRGYVLCLHHVLQRLLRYSPSSSRPCPCLRATNPNATRERRRGERERLTSPRSPRPRLALPPPWAGRKRVRGWSTRSCQSRPRRLRSRRREATRTRGALCPSPAASSIGPRRVWLSPPLAMLLGGFEPRSGAGRSGSCGAGFDDEFFWRRKAEEYSYRNIEWWAGSDLDVHDGP